MLSFWNIFKAFKIQYGKTEDQEIILCSYFKDPVEVTIDICMTPLSLFSLWQGIIIELSSFPFIAVHPRQNMSLFFHWPTFCEYSLSSHNVGKLIIVVNIWNDRHSKKQTNKQKNPPTTEQPWPMWLSWLECCPINQKFTGSIPR